MSEGDRLQVNDKVSRVCFVRQFCGLWSRKGTPPRVLPRISTCVNLRNFESTFVEHNNVFARRVLQAQNFASKCSDGASKKAEEKQKLLVASCYVQRRVAVPFPRVRAGPSGKKTRYIFSAFAPPSFGVIGCNSYGVFAPALRTSKLRRSFCCIYWAESIGHFPFFLPLIFLKQFRVDARWLSLRRQKSKGVST